MFLFGYCIESLFWRVQKMNLTAVREEDEVMERHVEDSLAIIEPIRSTYISHCGDSWENINLIDVGSGAGLPGLILAIACPGIYNIFIYLHLFSYDCLRKTVD